MNSITHFLANLKRNVFLWGLVLLLLIGWIVASILRLAFGETWYEKQRATLLENAADSAKADVPQWYTAGGGSGSTPFLAIWNGLKYVLENDFLFGKPRSYFASFAEGDKEHEANRVYPDLYKIGSSFKLKEGKLSLQIQEIETEESFINGFELMRVVHPATSAVFVDSEYRRFHVFDKKELSNRFITPDTVQSTSGKDVSYLANEKNLWGEPERHSIFNKNDYVDVSYSGLIPGERYFFALKSFHRVWIMGEDPSLLTQAKFRAASFVRSNILPLAQTGLSVLGLVWLARHAPQAAAPFLAIGALESTGGKEGPLWGGPGSTGGTSASGYCLPVSYKAENGEYRHVSTVEPRGWHYDTELVELPREAVSDAGNATIRVLSTECHHVAFVGLAQEPKQVSCTIEHLPLRYASHSRTNEDVTDSLQFKKGKYAHTIPGDVIELEFALPKVDLAEDDRETYLIRASGFYTYLSPKSKQIAGNWQLRIGEEARERLAMLEKTAPRIVRRV